MRTARLVAVMAFPLIAGLAGCAPAVLTERPSAWPEVWKGRRLYSTPNAFIYASSPELAGQFDRMATEVAGDFQRETHRTGCRGLLIASDLKDPAVCDDLEVLFMADKRRELTKEKGRPPTDAELQKARKDLAKEKDESGVDPLDAMGMVPIPLEQDLLEPQLGLPAEAVQQVRWAVLLPSDAMIRTTLSRTISASMAKEKMNPLARLALAPLLATVQLHTVKIVAGTRPVVMFEELARLQPDWSEKQIEALSDAYAEGKLRPAVQGLAAATAAATQPATAPAGGPATAPAAGPSTAPATAPAS